MRETTKMIRTGIDIVEVDRFTELINDEAFLERVFLPKEKEYIFKANTNEVKKQRMASRFAAKEAVYKALPLKKALVFKDICVLKEESGRPLIQLLGSFAVAMEDFTYNIDVSLSHSRDYAAASAVVAYD